MAAIKWMCCTCMLLYVAVAATNEEQLCVDEILEMNVQETQRAFANVERQLSAVKEMPDLFPQQGVQLQMLSEEIRHKLNVIQAEVKKEIDDAVLEVDNARFAALKNVTEWMKSLRELQEATERNKQTLQRIRERKELEEQQRKAEKELELQQREKQREKEIELERQKQVEEMKKMQEMKLREMEEQQALELQLAEKKKLEEQRVLKQLQTLEKEKKELEEQQKQHEVELQALEKEKERQKKTQQEQDLKELKEREAPERESDLTEEKKDNNDEAEETLPADSSKRTSVVKTVLSWYVSMEQTLLDTMAAVYRQLVLPVVAILGFFFLLTVAIAKYNAMKQAQRNRRVLYSGYPASYRRNVKQQEKSATVDDPGLEPRLRRSRPHRDPNGFLGN
ncbi:hypothetical protein P3T76_005401 [Phytophthora citrophthora]|uniref:Uncharacterized protein n=1 Tax=Phytophthora citrophthora TaxID=4793 RepID=A0AAD9GSK4_9STRA|nr:hypothetical protein P3T76_005401 [Phytophthora citrophthora]